MKAFTFHTDPGHGWLEVPVVEVIKLGMAPSDFTAFSYQSEDGNVLYLEEDCDATTFLRVWEQAYGTSNLGFDEKLYPTDHWIRDLPRIVSADEIDDEIWF